MKGLPKVKVAFFFTGDRVDLDEVTKIMGIKPTKTRKKEDFPIKEIAYDIWLLSTEKESCNAISLQLDKIISIIKDKDKLIHQICNNYKTNAAFLVNIWMENGDKPEMLLSKEIIAFASSIDAEIGFDLYVD